MKIIGLTKLIKHLKTIFLILIFHTLMLAQTSDNTEKNSRPEEQFYRPARGIRVILGVSGVYGLRYGFSMFINPKWSVELAHGRNKDINFGGGKYDMHLYGIAFNRYFFVERKTTFVTSVLYSYANVYNTSSEYPGDFNAITPMVGLDYSAKSGFGFFLRWGIIFATKNYQNGSGKFKADLGICWRFDFFSKP